MPYLQDFYDTKEGLNALKAGIPNADINLMIKPGDEMWRQRIVKGIGGSDAAAIFNKNPWKSPLTVYLEKQGLQDPPELTPAMEWGTRMEKTIAEKFAENNPDKIVAPGVFFQHRRYPWLVGDPDGLVFDADSLELIGGLEIKNVGLRSAHLWEDPGTDNVPDNYHIQCDWYMAGLELNQWWLVPLIGGQDYREYYISRSIELERVMLQRAEDFWKKYVEAGTPPPVGVTEADKKALEVMFPQSAKGKQYEPDADAITLISKMRDCDRLIKAAEKNKTAVVNQIMEKMGDAEFCVTEDGKISWKTQAGRVAWKKVVDEFMESIEHDGKVTGKFILSLLDKCVESNTSTPSRVFRPYWAKRRQSE